MPTNQAIAARADRGHGEKQGLSLHLWRDGKNHLNSDLLNMSVLKSGAIEWASDF
jgi:hypothetical protein